MTTRQRNTLTMFKVVRDYSLASKDITDKWPDFAEPFASFCNYIDQIEATATLQSRNNKPVRMNKGEIRAKLIELMLVASRKCKRYAKGAEKDDFLLLTKLVPSLLDVMADEDFYYNGE